MCQAVYCHTPNELNVGEKKEEEEGKKREAVPIDLRRCAVKINTCKFVQAEDFQDSSL